MEAFCCADLELPDFCDYAVDVPSSGTGQHEATRVLGSFFRDAIVANPVHLPSLRARRDLIEPASERVRGHGSDVGCRVGFRATTTWLPMAG